jgi:adenine phosphoribosyltransferase
MSSRTAAQETPTDAPGERRHRVQVGSQVLQLPLVDLSDDTSIALMMVIDNGIRFAETAGRELADRFRGAAVDIVVAPATLGIPLAIEATRALGLDDYLILQKSPKIHLRDALSERTSAITSAGEQRLLLDRARLPAVAHRRVLLLDDVVSTGSSIGAAIRLLERAEAELVGVGALLTEGDAWPQALGPYLDRFVALGHIPLFPRAPSRPAATSEQTALER